MLLSSSHLLMFLTLSRFIRIFVLGSLRLYQLIVSPYLGQNCRFYPSCSTFAYQAIEHYGVGRGLILTICRLCRCHPFSKGGVDPVKTGLDSPRIP